MKWTRSVSGFLRMLLLFLSHWRLRTQLIIIIIFIVFPKHVYWYNPACDSTWLLEGFPLEKKKPDVLALLYLWALNASHDFHFSLATVAWELKDYLGSNRNPSVHPRFLTLFLLCLFNCYFILLWFHADVEAETG